MPDDLSTSILTKGQREYLSGEKTPTQERTMKTRIRERLRAGFLTDIPLILEAIEAGQLSASAIVDDIDFADLGEAVETQAALLYLLSREQGLDFDRIVARGKNRAEKTRAEVLLEKYQRNPDAVTLGELKLLHETGLLDEAEHNEAIDEALASTDFGFVSREEASELIEEWIDDPDED